MYFVLLDGMGLIVTVVFGSFIKSLKNCGCILLKLNFTHETHFNYENNV